MNTGVDRAIKNFDLLATTPARASLLAIAEAGYHAIATPKVIQRAVQFKGKTLTVQGTEYDLSEYEHTYVLGIGKCALDAAVELEAMLGDHITEGVVLDVRKGTGLTRIRAYEGTHPYSSAQNAEYTRHLLDLAEKATAHDLVLVIVSGGGSALLCQPDTHTCIEEADLVKQLFKGGATINELNIIRKHLSKARGGHLAAAVHPADLIALIFSDVPGDDIHTIASGPTVRDTTTLKDARTVFEKYRADRSGFSVDHLIETPKESASFEGVRNELVLTNKTALEAMKERAEELGYTALIRDTRLEGEARDVAGMIVDELHTIKERTVLLYGGETTVTIGGPGKGGRNEELALAAIPLLKEDELLTSLASDGRDNTDLAGGIADSFTRTLAEEKNLTPKDYLYTNDSFVFFHTLQQGIETGYTGANVADLVIAIKHSQS